MAARRPPSDGFVSTRTTSLPHSADSSSDHQYRLAGRDHLRHRVASSLSIAETVYMLFPHRTFPRFFRESGKG